ncbi:MAG TPA: hypothetical protein VFP59_00130 [Candidatus Angelobacter sp.]|nr:hypothetical protein [Candidatus Angelobacter sp.]
MNGALRLYPVIAAVAVGVFAAARALVRSRRRTPEQRERERRDRINEIGRITDGAVIDVSEVPANGRGEIQLLIYQYDVGGVSYEASQDVTALRHRVDLHSCRAGLMTSIKYDPSNPGNSIVVAEQWSGLRN